MKYEKQFLALKEKLNKITQARDNCFRQYQEIFPFYILEKLQSFEGKLIQSFDQNRPVCLFYYQNKQLYVLYDGYLRKYAIEPLLKLINKEEIRVHPTYELILDLLFSDLQYLGDSVQFEEIAFSELLTHKSELYRNVGKCLLGISLPTIEIWSTICIINENQTWCGRRLYEAGNYFNSLEELFSPTKGTVKFGTNFTARCCKECLKRVHDLTAKFNEADSA